VGSITISLSVCLSVCPLAYLKDNMSRLYEIFFTCYLRPWLGPPLTTMRYKLCTGVCLSCFHIIRQIQTHVWSLRRSELFTVIRQAAPLNCAPAGKVCCRRLPCLWSPYVIGRPYIFSCCGLFFFLLPSSFFFFFPRLISAAGDWMFTILWHMVWP